jgi:3-hydroxyacyl-[acyl-carrier-protein] dehydratase
MRALLVDKIIQCEPGISITGIKNVTMSENFLRDHFPGFPVMPGVLQLEALFQLASWLVFVTSGYTKRGRPGALKSVKFKNFIVPGDQMLMSLKFTSRDEISATFDAQIMVNDKLKTDIRQGRITYVAAEELEGPRAAQEYFLFLSGKLPTGGYSVNKGTYLVGAENSPA